MADGISRKKAIGTTLQAQGHPAIRKHNPAGTSDFYDPAFVNTSLDLSELTEGLRRAKSARLCFYGPPGTGKTAAARFLSETLSLPLIVKRGPDLLSPFVGMNERNIADAFREAEDSQAILVIDEIDTFLQSRNSATRAWEIALVNEMLVQIETFAGIFIASTNIMDNLDQAALYRFDLKLRFDVLEPSQAWKLLIKSCSVLGIARPSKRMKNDLASLNRLTLGDFSVVQRQCRFHRVDSPEAFLAALNTEIFYADYREAAHRLHVINH